MMSLKLLDLYCRQGGAGMGYHWAGFMVMGVDNKPMPRYPFDFILCDAIEYLLAHGKEYDLIHASPVCKRYTTLNKLHRRNYPDQIAELREVLQFIGKPYIIENVVGAPLFDPLLLCGSMFGLRVYRHRLFECSPILVMSPMSCNHWGKASGNKSLKKAIRVTPNLDDYEIMTVTGHDFILADAKQAMGISWMSQSGISQAVPPVYTEYIGKQFVKILGYG